MIATVLILLLTISAVGILIAFVIPFVKDNLEEGGKCSDVFGGLEIVVGEGKSCYSEEAGNKFSNVSVRRENIDIDGIYLVFENPGSESFEISESGSLPADVTIPADSDNLPSKGGGIRTYKFDNDEVYTEVGVGAMVDGKRCGNPVREELRICR